MRGAALFLALMLLGGCASRQQPPVTSYRLETQATAPGGRQVPAEVPTLKLTPIRGLRPFSTTDMLYTNSGIEQNSFAWSRWSDSPLAMLQLLFTESLNRSRLFTAVLPASSTLRSDLRLEGTLLDFSLHLENDRPEAVMQIRFLLLDSRRRKALGSRLFSARIAVEEASPRSTATALGQASARIAGQLSDWLGSLDLSKLQ